MYNVSPYFCCHFNQFQFNLLIAGISSFLFFTGWWLLADIDVHNTLAEHQTYYIPGLAATAAFLFINIIPVHFFYDSVRYDRGCFTPGMARTYLFMWLVVSFGSLISAFFILVNDFMLHPKEYQWPGYGICLHNVLIFTSSMLLRFAKKHEEF